MSSRPSEDGYAALEHELRGEQASALGRAGRNVEEALAELWALPENHALRAERVDDAAYAVWCYFVQRECIGVRNHQRVIEFYRIPNEVLARVGAVRR